MNRFILLFCSVLFATIAIAQERQGYYIYQKNGSIDIFYTDVAKSISYSKYDLEGNLHPQAVTQTIPSGRLFSKIPLVDIDSISFTHPDPFRMKRDGMLNPITSKAFRSLVWDYKKHPNQLVFEGNRPVVMDYWAPWCGYCMQMMPLVQQLAQEYKGKVDFYKVNTDDETELSNVMGMTSLPCFYFYPKKGEPYIYMGAMDIASMRKIIEEVLLITDDENTEAVKPTIEVTAWKGNVDQEWTDRKLTANMKCTSQNATLVKYGCFLKEELVNSGLTPREMVQNYGQVLLEDLLKEVNGSKGTTLTLPVKKNKDYVFICMVKNKQGGIAVEQAEVSTDAQFTPVLDFQVQRGALEEFMQPGQKYITIYMKGNEVVTGCYTCLTTADYQTAIAAGATRQSLLEKESVALTTEEIAQANSIGFTAVIGGLQPETEYTCLAMVKDVRGKVSVVATEVNTAFDGYDDRISYPDINLVTSRLNQSVSCSVNCSTGNAIYAALLMIPSEELSKLMAGGQTLEKVMDTHPNISVFSDQQLEWVNGQGVSNVYPNLTTNTRFTWIADVRGRFGGRTVTRSEIQTLPGGATTSTMDIRLNASYVQGTLNASAQCTTRNATTATAALIESYALENLLAEGKTLEDVIENTSPQFLHRETFTPQQMEWFNQGGYIMGHSDIKKNTRYTWIIDVRGTKGERVVQRSEVLTPKF